MNNNKRARKDRCPNWSQQEILALIAAKREMFLEEVDAVDGRDLMTPDNTKWRRISQQVMLAGFSQCPRDGASCKNKWNQLVPDYKRISDYLGRTGRNIRDYWDLSSGERKDEGLPRQFSHEFYAAIDDWYGTRPQINPPHVRDVLSPHDANYSSGRQKHAEGEDMSEPETDPMDLEGGDAENGTEETTPPRSPRSTSWTPFRVPAASPSANTPDGRARGFIPPGVTPQIISSSETSSYSTKRRPGNTAVRRKNVAGHSVIAEATKATGAVMAQQMQDITQSSHRALEQSKIEVQLKISL